MVLAACLPPLSFVIRLLRVLTCVVYFFSSYYAFYLAAGGRGYVNGVSGRLCMVVKFRLEPRLVVEASLTGLSFILI